jgi:hypothetical protein
MKGALLFFLFAINISFGQNYPDLIPYKKGELWGYCDSNKTVKITPKFKGVSFFEANNVASVLLNDSTKGLINNKGQLLLEIPTKNFTIFIKDYYFKSNSNYRYQLFDSVGKPLSNFVYYLKPEAYLNLKNDLIKEGCIVMKDSAMHMSWDYGLINKKGETLIPFNCKTILPLNDTLLACVQKYYFKDFKKYSKKQVKKMISGEIRNDTCLLVLNLYTTKGKLIKSVYQNGFPETYNGQGFLLYKDFFIEYIEYFNDSSRLIERYQMRDYNGDIIKQDLKLSQLPHKEDIQMVYEGCYKIKNETGLYSLYEAKSQKFISDFIFNQIYFYSGKAGYGNINFDVYKLYFDSAFHIENCGIKYYSIFNLRTYVKEDNYFFYDKAWVSKNEKYHTILSPDGFPLFPANSKLNSIPTEIPLYIQFFKNYYYCPNFGWFDYNHKSIPFKNTLNHFIETKYNKLFYNVNLNYSHYAYPKKSIVGKGHFNGIFSSMTFFSINGIEYQDK